MALTNGVSEKRVNLLLHPTFLPNIAHFVAMLDAETIVFEAEDNYVKQTYRNRAYIYGANGKLALNIPITYSQKNRQKYCDVQIANTSNWQELHWKSILSAYRTSPFFEFYEDELSPLFQTKKDKLYDFNLECIEVIANCLGFELNYSKTKEFNKQYNGIDHRGLVNAKKESALSFSAYTQVFNSKHGFIPNLCILDLLCNEGPNALNYLESQVI